MSAPMQRIVQGRISVDIHVWLESHPLNYFWKRKKMVLMFIQSTSGMVKSTHTSVWINFKLNRHYFQTCQKAPKCMSNARKYKQRHLRWFRQVHKRQELTHIRSIKLLQVHRTCRRGRPIKFLVAAVYMLASNGSFKV